MEKVWERERCRADVLLNGVKPAHESDFSANTDPEALTSQLDILQARGVMAVRGDVTGVGRKWKKKGSKRHACGENGVRVNTPINRRIRAIAHDTTIAVDQGQDPGGPSVEVDGQRFRVRTARFSAPWLPDTPSHRHLTLVWRRWLVEAQGQPLLTWQEWAALVGSANRQAASQQVEDVRPCGADVRALVRRQRKVDAAVVDGVLHELLQTPLAGPTALVPRVNGRWGRHDLTVANVEGALAQISGVPVVRTRRRQLEAGHVPYQEAWRWTERRESRSTPAVPCIGWSGPSADRGRRIGDPTAAAGCDPLVEATVYDGRGDRRPPAGHEKGMANPGSAHRAATTRPVTGTRVRVEYDPPGSAAWKRSCPSSSAAWAVPACPRPRRPLHDSSGPSSGLTKPAGAFTRSSEPNGNCGSFSSSLCSHHTPAPAKLPSK